MGNIKSYLIYQEIIPSLESPSTSSVHKMVIELYSLRQAPFDRLPSTGSLRQAPFDRLRERKEQKNPVVELVETTGFSY